MLRNVKWRPLLITVLGASALLSAVVIGQSISTASFEAEQGTLQNGAQVLSDDTASGRSYLHFTPNVTASQWAFEETFDGAPLNPSQNLLPRTFDYVVTHRNHPSEPNGPWRTFPADHSSTDCAGPPSQHTVGTNHVSNSNNPDETFFICRDHMMSSMGEVDGYSVTNFYPKQEFDFASGNGIIEFDVNINGNPGRSWWEVLLTPRDEMHLGAAEDWLPIDETYPEKRILLTFWNDQKREIKVGTGAVAPNGWTDTFADWRSWDDNIDPSDPANTNRALRRKNRIIIANNKITWEVQKQDGTFDAVELNLTQPLPFTRGLVMFKTHAYTPEKDGNMNLYTYHWDNIRFNGPKLVPYRTIESNEIVNLAANGSRPIGDTVTQTINIDSVGNNPVLVGQIQQPMVGQTLLSINGNTNIDMTKGTIATCSAGGWTTFVVPINKSLLKTGANTFKWTVGPRNPCVDSWTWDGFNVKAFEIQFDGN